MTFIPKKLSYQFYPVKKLNISRSLREKKFNNQGCYEHVGFDCAVDFLLKTIIQLDFGTLNLHGLGAISMVGSG